MSTLRGMQAVDAVLAELLGAGATDDGLEAKLGALADDGRETLLALLIAATTGRATDRRPGSAAPARARLDARLAQEGAGHADPPTSLGTTHTLHALEHWRQQVERLTEGRAVANPDSTSPRRQQPDRKPPRA